MKQIAKSEDKSGLIELYNICFPGEEDYCEKFFDLVWRPENTLIYRIEGKIVSMLQMFDLTLTDGKRDYSAYYIFGAGTHPDYRGRNIMRNLISESERINSDKDFAVLIAGSESLKAFYGRLGYNEGFSFGKYIIKAGNFGVEYKIIDFSYCEKNKAIAAAEKINEIYLDSVHGAVVVKRTAALTATELSCREAKLFISERSYAIAEFSENEVFINEHFGESSDKLISQILWNHKIDKAEACSIGDTHSFGMYKTLLCKTELHGYLNLLFN